MTSLLSAPFLDFASSRRSKTAGVVKKNPQLSVIIVNYRQWENTAALVGQLRNSTGTRRHEIEFVVVDNHTRADRLARKLRRLPEVSLRRWGRNRGFARAVNEGCRLSQGSWFLLLNPDVSVTPEFVDGVLDLADRLTSAEPRAGIVGFQLLNADGTPQHSTGPFPTLAGTLAGLVLPRSRRKYRCQRCRQRSRVPWVTGCCVLVRRDCLKDLGGLDDDFFLYYEDVDLCRRARARGWTVWFEPNLRVVHHNPLHGRAVVPAILRLVTRHSLLTYAARHWPAWQFQVLAGIVGIEARARRWCAWWRNDAAAAAAFKELGALVAQIVRGHHRAARKRLERFVNDQ